jgi:hypothetical protein
MPVAFVSLNIERISSDSCTYEEKSYCFMDCGDAYL